VADLERLGARLIAICPQRPEFLKKMRDKHGLSFDILRDEGNEYAGKLGLRFVLPSYLQEVYLRLNLDLPRFNGDSSWSLAMPARYVINRDGTIAAADISADYTSRPEPAKTVEDVQGIV
jgi:peroxiredoxin